MTPGGFNDIANLGVGDQVCEFIPGGQRWGDVEHADADAIGVRWEATPDEVTSYHPTRAAYWVVDR